MCFTILFFDPTYCLSYAILFGIIILIYNSSYYQDIMYPIISDFLFGKLHPVLELEEENKRKKNKDEKYFQKYAILTRKQINEKKNIEELQKEELKFMENPDENAELEEDDNEEDFKEKLSNYFTAKSKKSGLTLALEGISTLCFYLETAITVIEKGKNLIMWKSKMTTMLVLIGLCIAYLAVTFIPLRWIITLGVLQRFSKGYKFYHRVKTSNAEVARIQICEFLNIKDIDPSNEWPKMKNLEKKLNVHMQQNINIFLPNDWMAAYPTPKDLIEEISTIKTIVLLPVMDKKNPKLYIKIKNPPERLIDFLMNNVPSDSYLMKYFEEMISKNYI